MSIKTTIKRTALVVVSALTMGIISTVNANAAVVGTPTVTTANGTASIVSSDSTGAASVAVRFYTSRTDAGDTAVVSVTAGTKPSTSAGWTTAEVMMTALDTSSSSGAASTLTGKGSSTRVETYTAWSTTGGLGKDSNTATYARGVIVPGASAGYGYGKFGFFMDSNSSTARVAGTYTIDYLVQFYESGTTGEKTTAAVAGSINIVVSNSALAAAGAVTASATSTAVLYGGATFIVNNTVDSTVAVVNTPSSSTPSAVIQITQKTADGSPSRESITVTTNIGNVGTATSATGKKCNFCCFNQWY